jgi:nucleoside-triphosphatase THEP1
MSARSDAVSGALARRVLSVAAVVCIAIQFHGSLLFSALALGCWLASLALLSPRSLRRMWLPRFWLLTIVIAVGSGLLLGERDAALFDVPYSRAGMEAGLLMVVRGAFIFGLTSWGSRELNLAWLHRAARRVGMGNLATAVSTAMGLLPDLKQRLDGARSETAAVDSTLRARLTSGYRKAIDVVARTAEIAEEMAQRQAAARQRSARESSQRGGVFAIVGAPRSGKTSTALEIAERLRRAGREVGGILQPAVVDGGRSVAYRVRDLATGEERTLARHRRHTHPGEICFVFDDDVWQWAADRIRDRERRLDLVVVDELGRLEARGEGHMPGLVSEAAGGERTVRLVVVREEFAGNIESRIGPFAETIETNADTSALDAFVARIEEAIERRG